MTKLTITEALVSVGSQEEALIRVLHVDDDTGFLRVARQILEMQGSFEVETTSSVEEAMGILENKSFDVIVSDYIMPAKTGLDFLKELRVSGNNLPFIIFTGKGREEIAIEALNLGADHYINKIGKPETVYYELAHGIHQAVERKKAEEKIRESEQKLRAILASSPNNVTVTDFHGNILECNQATLEMGGFSSKDEVIGKNALEFIAKKDHKRAMEHLKKIIEQDSLKNIQYTGVTKDGYEFPSEFSVSVIRDSSGNPIGFVSITRDITERKKAEEALKESEAKYRRIVELAPDSIITANAKGVVTSVNTRFTRLTGFSKDEIVGKHFTKVGTIRKRDLPIFLKMFASLLRGKAPKPFEVMWKHKDGTANPTEIHVTLVKSDGKTIGFQAISRDITERKKTEDALRDSNEKWVSLMESTNDVIMTLDDKGTIQYINSTPLAANPEETIGKSVYEYVPSEQHDIMRESLRRVFKTGKPVSYEVSPNIQGIDTIWFSTKVVPVKHDGKIASVILISTDITERKKAEEKSNKLLHGYGERIKELRCLYALSRLVEKPNISKEEILQGTNDLLQSAWQYPDVTCSRIIFENREFKTENFKETPWKQSSDIKIKGKKAGVVEVYYLEEKPTIAEGPFLKEERALIDAVAERLGKIIERKETQVELQHMFNLSSDLIGIAGADGYFKKINPSIEKILGYTVKEFLETQFLDLIHPNDRTRTAEAVRKEFSTGVPTIQFMNRYRCKDGSYKWLEWTTHPVKEKGLTYTVARDITERKKTQEDLETTLKKLMALNEKLEVVGKLTRHDIRNKLQVVTSNVYLAKKRLTDNHEIMSYLGDVESACDQMEKIFDFSETYERLGMEELAYMDVEKSLKEAVIQFSDFHGAKIVNDCHGLTVLADSLLRQTFYNLIHNSLKHGEKVSQIRVHYEEAGKDKLKLVYEDDGVGIPKAEKDKIFMEGYGKGTGYGLYLIRKMCEVYGWTIKETGKESKGAQFTMSIPQLNEQGNQNYKLD